MSPEGKSKKAKVKSKNLCHRQAKPQIKRVKSLLPLHAIEVLMEEWKAQRALLDQFQ